MTMTRKIITFGIAGTAALLPASLRAQTTQPDKAAERADARLQRLDRDIDRPMPSSRLDMVEAKQRDFTLAISLPFTFNSNVENATTGPKSAFHVAPAAKLDWKHKVTGSSLVFFARAAADSDSYTRFGDNNGSTLGGRFGVRIDDPKLGKIKPYFHYSPTAVFAGSFYQDHLVTTHTFALGANGVVPLGAPDASKVSLTFDLQLARREATAATSEFDRGLLSLSLGGPLVPNVEWSLGATVQRKNYTGGANDGRRDTDLLIEPGISIALNPGVADGRPGLSLDIGLSFDHNFSNRPGKVYTTVDVGPTLGLTQKF